MNDVIKKWINWIIVLILVFIVLSPASHFDDVIKGLASFQIKTIGALQGE